MFYFASIKQVRLCCFCGEIVAKLWHICVFSYFAFFVKIPSPFLHILLFSFGGKYDIL